MAFGSKHGPRRTPKPNRDPLRQVIGHTSMVPPWAPDIIDRIHGIPVPLEILECGHLTLPRSDYAGATHAQRRRCDHCAAGRPPHLEGAEILSIKSASTGPNC